MKNVKKKKTIQAGITLAVRSGAQSLWENGIYQNVFFLAMLLKNIPFIGEVFIVPIGKDWEKGLSETDKNEIDRFLTNSGFSVATPESALDKLDLMIEMSATTSPEWVRSFRAKGGKTVIYHVGNNYIIDIERMMYNLPNAWLVQQIEYDAVWTIAEYEKSNLPYLNILCRQPAQIVPHLWSPDILEQGLKHSPNSRPFDYTPGRKRWRIGIFEPNINMTKTCFVPLLLCEAAHQRDVSALEQISVYSAEKLAEKQAFQAFARQLTIWRHGLVSFCGRLPIWHSLPTFCDAMVAHQWENAQNYTYYEALYGGYPLIHNSHLIGHCGYRYHGFDCEEGGRVLLDAMRTHDANLRSYREQAQQFLQTLRPDAPGNVQCYGAAIEKLFC